MPMCVSLPNSITRVLLVAVLLGVGLTTIGCASNGPRPDDPLVMENQELRRLNENLQIALDDAEARYRALDEQNRQLAGQLAAQPEPLGDTGFEGLGAGVSRRAGEVVVDIAGEVLFDSGSVTVKPAARGVLDGVVRVIKQRYPGAEIRVAGYTDNDPIKKSDWKTNERLSAERAMAVESYLVSKGISNDVVHSAAYGPAKAKSSKRESRRVEIIILE
ncbi:MAG: OmpA family protein [Phycisphaera sp.]|nr:MAG: OmpA family protein [Phycisphaera sp.]